MMAKKQIPAVMAARAECERLDAAMLALTERRAELEAALAAARERAAADVLEAALAGADTAGLARRVSELEADLAATVGAIATAESRRRAAGAHLQEAQAADLREQAAELRSQAAERQTKTDALVAELVAHEGVDAFVPWVRLQGDGTIPPIPWPMLPELARRFTKTGYILNQAATLELQALDLERAAKRALGLPVNRV